VPSVEYKTIDTTIDYIIYYIVYIINDTTRRPTPCTYQFITNNNNLPNNNILHNLKSVIILWWSPWPPLPLAIQTRVRSVRASSVLRGRRGVSGSALAPLSADKNALWHDKLSPVTTPNACARTARNP